jgi:hypothetical protein
LISCSPTKEGKRKMKSRGNPIVDMVFQGEDCKLSTMFLGREKKRKERKDC